MVEVRLILSQYVAFVVWVVQQWWFWLVLVITGVGSWYMFKQRSYMMVDGELFVRHGRLGEWMNVREHLEIEHPLERELLQDEKGNGSGVQ